MEFRIQRLARPDLRAAAQTLSNAFQSDPLYNFTVPNPEHRSRWLPIFKREILRITLPFGETYVALDSAGRPLGAMALTPPGKFPHPWWANARMTVNAILFPTPWCPTLSKAWKLRRYAEVFDEIHFRGPHWYVDTIGIDALYQGQGIGTALMRRAIELSTSNSMPIWLETQTEANVGYYQSFGFRVTVQKHPVPGGPPTWGMLREHA